MTKMPAHGEDYVDIGPLHCHTMALGLRLQFFSGDGYWLLHHVFGSS